MAEEGCGVDVEGEAPDHPDDPMPSTTRAALGCGQAVLLMAVLSLLVAGLLAWVVGRAIGGAREGRQRVADNLRDRYGDEPTFGPGDGIPSERRALSVAPAEGLADGAVVVVSSVAFADATIVGVTVCDGEDEVAERGIGACDLNEFTTFAVPADGRLWVPYRVPRVATVGDQTIDCAAGVGSCTLLLADMEDYRRSGIRPLAFAPGLAASDLRPSTGPRPPEDLPITATPAGPVAAGTQVEVRAEGFVPGEPLQVSVCSDAFAADTASPTQACAALHDLDWYLGVRFGEAPADPLATASLQAGADGVATATVTAVGSFRPFGSGVADGPDPQAPLVDCRDRPGRCAIVVAAAADATRAAVLPYELAR